jgi:hypothetical protein
MLLPTSTDAELLAFYLGLNDLLRPRGMPLLPPADVHWTTRLPARHWGRSYAYTVKNKPGEFVRFKILVNQKVFTRLPGRGPLELEATLRHEAAHIWTAAHAGRMDHSLAWRHTARILGDTGHVFAGCPLADVLHARAAHHAVPTAYHVLDKKQLHALRTSFTHLARRRGFEPTAANFDLYIRRRFPHFSDSAVAKARDLLCAKPKKSP